MRLFKKWNIIISFLVIGIVSLTLVCAFPLKTANNLISVGFSEKVVSRIYKGNAEVLFMLGNRHLGGDGEYNLQKAEEYYLTVISINEKYPYAHYQLSRVYFLTTRYEMALVEVNKELEYNPDFPRSYYLRGLIYGYNKRLEEAEKDFRTFIALKPEEWAGYNDLAWVLFQQGKYQETKEAMETILASSKNAWLLNSYGVALMNLGEFETARIAFLEANELVNRMTPELWGNAYIGNDPKIYSQGLQEMKRNIEENLDLINSKLSKK